MSTLHASSEKFMHRQSTCLLSTDSSWVSRVAGVSLLVDAGTIPDCGDAGAPPRLSAALLLRGKLKLVWSKIWLTPIC